MKDFPTSERNARIYWERVRGEKYALLAREHGISAGRVREIYEQERRVRVLGRIKQEAKWLRSRGLDFLVPELCYGQPQACGPIDGISGCRLVATGSGRVLLRLADAAWWWKQK